MLPRPANLASTPGAGFAAGPGSLGHHPPTHLNPSPHQHHHQHHHHRHPDQKRLLHDERRSPPSTDLATAFQLDRPFKLPLYPPPSYAQTHNNLPDSHNHHPKGLIFPDAPQTELPPIQPFTGARNDEKKTYTLPSLSHLTAAPASSPLYSSPSPQSLTQPTRPAIPPAPAYAPPPVPPQQQQPSPQLPAPPRPSHWPSCNPLTAYYAPSHVQGDEALQMETDSTNNSVASAASPECYDSGRASSVSLDDPDVRLAAEALGDLRADFVSSPPHRTTPLPATPRSQSNVPPEPLLQLLTTNHPLLGNVIGGTQLAYSAGKNYSPRFKSGAEYVEGYVTPIANTVGSVGRVTGVEGGVRWFLGGGRRHKSRSTDLEVAGYGSNKRRKVEMPDPEPVDDQEDEPMSGTVTPRPTHPHDRRLSVASTVDTLPAYDELRSPAYTEQNEPRPNSSSAWQSRLILSTSGLSIAMSEESLRSLKYCLSWLRWANVHIGNVINSLKVAMERYDRSSAANGEQMMLVGSSSSEANERNEVAARINALRADVLKTLQDVISTVSKYAGGALPDNARILVRRHLTSLPQRFRIATMTGDGQRNGQMEELSAEEAGQAKEKEMREGAQKVLVLAKEGLDMMAQVSGVLDGTIVSAEEWCERLGRKKRQQREELYDGPRLPTFNGEDVKMAEQ